MAEAGWYSLPSDPSKVMYYDGRAWVGDAVPAPPTAPVIEDDRSDVPDLDALLGTSAVLAGGAVMGRGLRDKRGSMFSAFIILLFGVLLIVAGFNAVSFFESVEKQPGEQRELATVTLVGTGDAGTCSPIVLVAGVERPLLYETVLPGCPVSVGDDVAVFTTAGSVRLAPGSSLPVDEISWVLMGIGALTALVGLGQVIRRGVLIAGGGSLVNQGLSKRGRAR